MPSINQQKPHPENQPIRLKNLLIVCIQTNKTKEPFDRMYSDLFEKFPIQSAGGALYYVSLIDEKTRYA